MARSRKKRNDFELPEAFAHHRALIFSMSLAGGLIILLTIRDTGAFMAIYWILAALMLPLLAVEVLTTYRYAKKKLDRIDLPYIPDNTIRPNMYYHAILPLILYISSVVYIFLDFNTAVDIILITLITITYYAFLRHVRATYENDFKTEEWSHNVLDAANVIIFFTVAAAIAEAWLRFEWKTAGVVILLAVVFLIFMLLTLWKRLEMGIRGVLVAIMLSLLLAAITWVSILYLPAINKPLAAGAWWALVYYLLAVAYVHKLEGTLKKETWFEYFLIALVAVFLLAQV